MLSWSFLHPEYQSVIDDLAARKFAQPFGIALCGTIGVIVIARKIGIIPSAGLLLNRLVDVGFRIDDKLFSKMISRNGMSRGTSMSLVFLTLPVMEKTLALRLFSESLVGFNNDRYIEKHLLLLNKLTLTVKKN